MTASDGEARVVNLVPPTAWGVAAIVCDAPRLASFDGVTLGLLANGKANSDAILAAIAADLARRHHIADVVRATKPHPSLPVSDEVLAMFAQQVQVVLTAIGD
jgi:hypothetical protein